MNTLGVKELHGMERLAQCEYIKKKKSQYVCGAEVELGCKCQDDHRSKCDSNEKYLLKESEKECGIKERRKEKRRGKQNLVVLKSIRHTSSKKNHTSSHY